MNKTFMMCLPSLLFALTALCQQAAHASDLNVDMSATILNSTCQTTISNNSVIALGTVGVGYFGGATPSTPDMYQGGGKTFTISLHDCGVGADTHVTQLHMNFRPLSGQFAPGSMQIFPNEAAASINAATNVGVIISAVENNGSVVNVWDQNGQSQANFAITPEQLESSTYTFYTRFQKTGTGDVKPGQFTTNIVVDVYYD